MAAEAAALRAPAARRTTRASGLVGGGFVAGYLTLIVLLPLAAVAAHSGNFRAAVTNRQAVSALELTLVLSILVALVNAIVGTATAWVLVRDDFRGKRVVNAVIDLPFALPTIVAGITLLALYGPNSPTGINVVGTRWAILMALLFVTLPFVVRSVQPVLIEVDREMEEAAASLGAPNHRIFRSIILPNLTPAIIAGVALAFARAVGEFGSLVLLTGNIPFKTQAASVYIFGRVQTNDLSGAAAVSVFLLAISVGLLLALNLFASWRSRHERA